MASKAWPPISDADRIVEEKETLLAERVWLLSLLQDALPSLLSTLQDCLTLLSPSTNDSNNNNADSTTTSPPSSVLALSSHRSESVKGIITRTGTRLSTGTGFIALRLPSLPTSSTTSTTTTAATKDGAFPLRIHTPTSLPQLSHLLTLLNQALDIIDVSRWTGDPQNGAFISAQLKLLWDTIEEARVTLKGVGSGGASTGGGDGNNNSNNNNSINPPVLKGWWEQSASQLEETWGSELPRALAPHLSIADAAVVLHVRTLGPPPPPKDGEGGGGAAGGLVGLGSFTGLSIRARLGLASRPQMHDEMEEVFSWMGEEVGVKEKVRVESQDPSLMAVMAKLGALAHAVGSWRVKVGVVMGEEVEI